MLEKFVLWHRRDKKLIEIVAVNIVEFLVIALLVYLYGTDQIETKVIYVFVLLYVIIFLLIPRILDGIYSAKEKIKKYQK